ncbi:MAG: NTP transferase domain-containing protein [Vicinamibacterales bacterium]
MKAVVLAAGANNPTFPLGPFARPKCLYSRDGVVQLQRVLDTIDQLGLGTTPRVVVGYRAADIARWTAAYGRPVELTVNPRYREAAVHSVLAGLAGVDDDVLLLFADERVSAEALDRLARAPGDVAFFVTRDFPRDSMNALKIGRAAFHLFDDPAYVDGRFLDGMRRFLADAAGRPRTPETPPPADLDTSTGWALGYVCLDVIRRRSGLELPTDSLEPLGARGVTPVPFDPDVDGGADLDRFEQADEYRQPVLRFSFRVERRLRHLRARARLALRGRR